MTNTARNYYLVRTKPSLIEKSRVGIGWSRVDFSKLNDANEAIKLIKAEYGSIGRYSNQIRRFFKIKKGDLVVVTLPHSIAIGEALGDMLFDDDAISMDRANQQKIAFPRVNNKLIRTPRSEIKEAFQRRLRVQGMVVNDLNEFSDEIETAYEKVSCGENYSWQLMQEEKQDEVAKTFRKQLLKKIKQGETNLKSGGIGLEHLVRELLEIEGYQADVMAKNTFSGSADADVKASRSDVFSTVDINLLIQVKHHQGFTGVHALKQLEEIKNDNSSDWSGYKLMVCTSASVSKEFKDRASNSNIAVMDGDRLVHWIYQHRRALTSNTRKRLGITDVPILI